MSKTTHAQETTPQDEAPHGAPQAGGFSGVAAPPGEGALAREARNGWGWIMVDGVPRRSRVDHWTPAERAIADAVDVVERAGCDVRLTTAVTLLGKARDAVADFVDGCDTEAAQARALGATQPAPAPSSPRAEAPEAEREDAAALLEEAAACIELAIYGDDGLDASVGEPVLVSLRAALRRAAPGAAPEHIALFEGWVRKVPMPTDYTAGWNDALDEVLTALRATPAPTGERAGGARADDAADVERMNWLVMQGVVSIYFADGSQFNPASMTLRAAIDAAARPAPVAAPRGTEGRDDA